MAIDAADAAHPSPAAWPDRAQRHESDLSLPRLRDLYRALHPALPQRQRSGALLELSRCPDGGWRDSPAASQGEVDSPVSAEVGQCWVVLLSLQPVILQCAQSPAEHGGSGDPP